MYVIRLVIKLKCCHFHIVAYIPVARQRPRNKRDNSYCLVTAVKHVSDIQNMARQLLITTIEELLGWCFLFGPPRGYITRTPDRLRRLRKLRIGYGIPELMVGSWDLREFFTSGCDKRTWAREAEESSLLKPLPVNGWLKHSRLEKGVASAVLISKVWRLAMAL
jgi:hypothetical protein